MASVYLASSQRDRRDKPKRILMDSPRGDIREGYPLFNVFYANAPRGDDFCMAASFLSRSYAKLDF